MPVRQEIARIAETKRLSPSVRGLSLELSGGPLCYEPGQWVNLHVPTPGGPCKRAYSLAGRPGQPFLEIAVTHVPDGRASPWLCSAELGAELALDGPHGFFCQTEGTRSRPNLWVATGTGLSPFRSMAHSRDADDPPTVVLFGCRGEQDILWRQDWEAWAAAKPGRRFEVTLSRPSPGWCGRSGYVQEHLVELAGELAQPHVFICGLSRMVSDVRGLCKKQLGFDRQQLHSERYD